MPVKPAYVAELQMENRILRRDMDRFEADLRALRSTVDTILATRNQMGAGLVALMEDVQQSDEGKQKEEDFKLFQAFLREAEEV